MVGCLMQLLARNLAVGLSLTAIIVSPAFGYAGVGFPVTAMGWFPRAWGAILPLRWYVQILFDQASRGAPLRETAAPFAMLCALTIGTNVAGMAALPLTCPQWLWHPPRRRTDAGPHSTLASPARLPPSGGAC